jgi:hypothetical protein
VTSRKPTRAAAARQREEAAWQTITDLLTSRCEVTGRGLAPRQVRDTVDAARDRQEAPAEFAARWLAVGGPASPIGNTDPTIADLLNGGWPVDAYQRLWDLQDTAVACGAYVYTLGTGVRAGMDAGYRLVDTAEIVVAKGGTYAQVFPWMEVLAQAADRDVASVLWSSLLEWGSRPRSGPFLGPGWSGAPSTWAVDLGARAALAWAAGLDYDDAVARHAAGALDVAALQMLAVLRGFSVTAPEVRA